VSSIDTDRLKRFSVPLAPTNEQQRVVEKIETLFGELDKGEEALREVQKLLSRYRQSVLKAAVTGELTADWRAANPPHETGKGLLARILKQRREAWRGSGKYKEPIEPDTEGLPELPEGWVWMSLEMILADFITGPFGSMLHKSDYVQGGTPIINPINLVDEKVVPDDRKGVGAATLDKLARFAVRAGDVVIARRGDMGRCAPVTGVEDGWLCGTGSMILRPAEPVQSRYLSAAITSHTSKAHLEKHAVGTTMKNLNQRALFSTPIALPSRAEQDAVVNAIDEANERISQIEMWCDAECRRSAALRQSILKDAFSGKLVPQDQSDEPAEELLERIRSARSEKTKPTRKKAVA
jgi:type I restriction enzyme S subunit